MNSQLYNTAKNVNHKMHKVHIYTEYHSVCPSSELGLSHPFSRHGECAPPPELKGGGGIRLWARGRGSPNSDDRRKSLALCLLCDEMYAVVTIIYVFIIYFLTLLKGPGQFAYVFVEMDIQFIHS
jgi:hypothetical protein